MSSSLPLSLHAAGAKPFPCRCCSKKFSDKRNLISHIKNRHSAEAPELLAMLKNPRRAATKKGGGSGGRNKKAAKKSGALDKMEDVGVGNKSDATEAESTASDSRMPHLSDSSTSPEREMPSQDAIVLTRGASSDTEHLTFASSVASRRMTFPARNTRSTSSEASAASSTSSHFSTVTEHSSGYNTSNFSLSRSPPRVQPIIAAPHNPPALRIQAALNTRFPPPLLPKAGGGAGMSAASGTGLESLPPPLVVKMEGLRVPNASLSSNLPPPLTLDTKGVFLVYKQVVLLLGACVSLVFRSIC